ncbi:MAG: hypothetical protein ACSLFN_13515 [Candidatus Limnocylindrales bacterium]
MNHYYTFLALDLARDRALDAARDRRALEAAAGWPSRPNLLVRGLAHGLALVSRGSTAAVRRLDECVADDLNQALAASK